VLVCWYCGAKVKAKRIWFYSEWAWYYHCRKCNSIYYEKVKEVSDGTTG